MLRSLAKRSQDMSRRPLKNVRLEVCRDKGDMGIQWRVKFESLRLSREVPEAKQEPIRLLFGDG